MRLYALLGTTAVVAALAIAGPVKADVPEYSSVTQDRLDHTEPRNWLMYRGNYQSWGYSSLSKITAANVKELVPVWSVSTGVLEGHQSPPIVNDGVMFVSTP